MTDSQAKGRIAFHSPVYISPLMYELFRQINHTLLDSKPQWGTVFGDCIKEGVLIED
jgi:hypothetical protein